jgi:hypothetical protein
MGVLKKEKMGRGGADPARLPGFTLPAVTSVPHTPPNTVSLDSWYDASSFAIALHKILAPMRWRAFNNRKQRKDQLRLILDPYLLGIPFGDRLDDWLTCPTEDIAYQAATLRWPEISATTLRRHGTRRREQAAAKFQARAVAKINLERGPTAFRTESDHLDGLVLYAKTLRLWVSLQSS